MRIEFGSIRVVNFRSVGAMGITIDLKDGVGKDPCIVFGENGAGKSTIIMHGVYYALFGKAYGEKDKLSSLVNSVNKKGLIAELTFSINDRHYLIRRGMQPSIFDIEETIGDVTRRLDDERISGDYQGVLEGIIGMSAETFSNTIALGLDKFKPFMSMTVGDRRDAVETYLDLSIFSMMNTKTKAIISGIESSITELKLDAERVEREYTHKKDKAEQAKINDTGKITEYRDMIKEHQKSVGLIDVTGQKLQKDLADLKVTYDKRKSEYDAWLPKIKEHRDKGDQVVRLRGDLARPHHLLSTVKSLDNTIKNVKELTVCHACEQTVGDDHKEILIASAKESKDKLLLQIEKDRGAIGEEIGILEVHIEELTKELTVVPVIQKDLTDINNQASRISADINSLTREKQNLLNTISNIEERIKLIESSSESNKYQDEIEVLEDRMNDIMNQGRTKDRELLIAKNGLFMLQDKAIKRDIIKTYIPILNVYVNQILDQTGLRGIGFSMDADYKIKFKAPSRKGQTTASLSNGQKRRIDLALLLSWMRITEMKGSVESNLLIMDEILDSISPAGIEDIMNLIRQNFTNTNIFIVSQRQEELFRHTTRKLGFKLMDDFTLLED